MIENSIFVYLLVFQFVVSFVYLWRINKGFFMQDIRVFFLICFALYTLFWPIMYIVLDFMVEDRPFVLTMISYNLAILAFNIVTITSKRAWPVNAPIAITERKNTFLWGLLFLIFLVAYSFYFMYSKGIPVFAFSSFNMDRLDYFQSVDQVWVVLKFIIAGAASFLIFHYKQLSPYIKWGIIASLVFYILYQISLGNRNEYTLIVFFALGYFLASRGKPLNLRILVVLLVLFAFSFYITIMRSSSARTNSSGENVQLVMQSNEFMFPIQTTYYTIKDRWPLRYGETYTILPIQQIIPRAWQKNKPQILGSEFISKTFSSGWSGWAYTPVTEAYLNFGIIGPFIIYFLIAMYLNHLIFEVRRKGITYKYLVIFSMLFNFCRGEAASTIYMALFLWMTYLVMKTIIPPMKKNSKTKYLRNSKLS